MGFFSWDCKRCGLAIMSPYQVNEDTAWLNEAVALTSSGSMQRGDYDGYGRINGSEIEGIMDCQNPEMYHKACWKLAGSPTEFTGESKSAQNQGYFIGEDAPEWTATEPTK
jgi:hypothetical protein